MASSSVAGQDDLARLMQELQALRDSNASLQREVQGLSAQVQQRPTVQTLPVRAKPSTFNGEERMLEGWLANTRDILVECYGLLDGPEIVRAARIYLEGPARTSWGALERSWRRSTFVGRICCLAASHSWLSNATNCSRDFVDEAEAERAFTRLHQ